MKKNKQKTRKAAKKRFIITGSGKVKYNKSGRRHLLEHKASKLVRSKRNKAGVSKTDIVKIRACLPGLKIKE